MIVLDEQLLGTNLELAISTWYPGSVRYITELRPASVIKDDNIAHLLHSQNQPVFITINESDFWRKIDAHPHYCVICFALPNSRATGISDALRSLFSLPQFNSRAKRMGKVIHVSPSQTIRYYSRTSSQIITISD